MQLTYTDPDTARLYVDVVLSLSELGNSRFGRPLVMTNYTDVRASLTSLDKVEEALQKVKEKVQVMTPGHPRSYMKALVRSSTAMLGVLRGEDRPYRELVRDILEVEHTFIPESESERLRSELHEGLAKLGYSGKLDRQIKTWLQDTSLTGDSVIDWGQSIIDRARRDTEARVLKLPPGEGIDSFTGVRNVHYSGRSQYSGGFRGWLQFNIDKQWQRDLFVHVLCHEAYPGHQTFYALWDQLYQQGRWPVEAGYYQLNSPTNTVFEGGPEIAMHMLGWDEGEDSDALSLRMGVAYMDLGQIAMNNACLACNTGQMTRGEAVDLMVDHFVLPEDAERAYEFFTDSLARTNYAQYYYGRRIVRLAFERFEGSIKGRQDFFDILYRTPHSTSTFIQVVAEASGQPFDPFTY